MIKKATTEPKVVLPKEATDAPVERGGGEKWNVHWNIHRRLLEARRLLRSSKLWATFEAQRSFEAFSIHALARGVEEVLNDLGVTSHFAPTKWQKAGNTTVMEGLVVFTNVDTGETVEIPTIGEGVDPDDKGMGKADSYARKIGLVNALNLGIGVDNEASQQQAHPGPQAGPTMSGSPQQGTQTKTAGDYIHPAANGHAPANVNAAQKMYTLQQQGTKARSVLGSGMLPTCWAIIQNTMSTQTLDDWEALNLDMLKEFSVDDPTTAGQLHKLSQARRATLMGKGL